MPELRCKPNSALCAAQSAETHLGAAAATAVGPVERLAACLREAAESLQRAQEECARVHGTNESRFRILQALADHGGPECTQAELAGKLQQSESHLSSQVEKLALEGLLCRERSIRDRRKTMLWTTTEGRRVAQSVAEARSRMLNRLLESWTVDQVQVAAAALRRLAEDLDVWPALLSGVSLPPVSAGVDALPPSPSNAR
jgi:DNA-binding MarR family transcriptional regulator